MIYRSLHTLPILVAEEIVKTDDVRLLSTEPYPLEDLLELWENLEPELQSLSNPTGGKNVLNVSKEMEFLANKYDIIQRCCAGLRFDKSDEVIQILNVYGYRFDINNYQSDLERIERESQGIEIKIKQLQKTLPTPKSENADGSAISDIMAGYSVFLGISFRFNECTCTEFFAYEKQVGAKIKAIETAKSKTK